ncbi:unnamed protein product [Amoebophrya sp. A25]|nr:unnamed protein product [Amoebophrya sp. A25]|eukprot:GSA25T00013887001.1
MTERMQATRWTLGIAQEPPKVHTFKNAYFKYHGNWQKGDLGKLIKDGPGALLLEGGRTLITCTFANGEIDGNGTRVRKLLSHKRPESLPPPVVDEDFAYVTDCEIYRGQFRRGEAHGHGTMEKNLFREEGRAAWERYEVELEKITQSLKEQNKERMTKGSGGLLAALKSGGSSSGSRSGSASANSGGPGPSRGSVGATPDQSGVHGMNLDAYMSSTVAKDPLARNSKAFHLQDSEMGSRERLQSGGMLTSVGSPGSAAGGGVARNKEAFSSRNKPKNGIFVAAKSSPMLPSSMLGGDNLPPDNGEGSPSSRAIYPPGVVDRLPTNAQFFLMARNMIPPPPAEAGAGAGGINSTIKRGSGAASSASARHSTTTKKLFKSGDASPTRSAASAPFVRYTGGWRENRFHGEGKLETPDMLYKGTFQDHKFHGEGRLKLSSGERYLGQFSLSSYEGEGFQRTAEDVSGCGGTITYIGQFESGRRNGTGAGRCNATGLTYQGVWADDYPVAQSSALDVLDHVSGERVLVRAPTEDGSPGEIQPVNLNADQLPVSWLITSVDQEGAPVRQEGGRLIRVFLCPKDLTPEEEEAGVALDAPARRLRETEGTIEGGDLLLTWTSLPEAGSYQVYIVDVTRVADDVAAASATEPPKSCFCKLDVCTFPAVVA